MDNSQKIQTLRQMMGAAGVDAYLIPHGDAYQSEYPPESAKRLEWFTGFSGSAGIAIVTMDQAVVMSDGRYTIQLSQQVDPAVFSIEHSQKCKVEDWLKQTLSPSAKIGYDLHLMSAAQIQPIQKAGFKITGIEDNLVDKIWTDRPTPPCGETYLFPDIIAGRSAVDKIALIRSAMLDEADGVMITQPESIAWLLNIRGTDIPFNPVALSYLFLPKDGRAQWFIDLRKITDAVRAQLESLVTFCTPDTLAPYLETLSGQTVMLDPKRSVIWFQSTLEKAGVTIMDMDDPCLLPRACKTPAEQEAMRAAHIRDGVAMVKFLKWFEDHAGQGALDELTVEQQLLAFRAQAAEFVEPSFSTIAGFGANGAIVHYRATEQSNKRIENGNLLLLDSGAQYRDGTTDITRTIAVGTPTHEMIHMNTLVLKGHIAVATAVFDPATPGKEIDALARQFLHKEGLDYGHGTGHGVGCHLSVHEEATSLSPREDKPFHAGMIISNEPGYYKEGAFGIRIENLLLVKENTDGLFCFDTLTLAPLDRGLIDKGLLTDLEKQWIEDYHQTIKNALHPYLDKEHWEWLSKI